MVKILCITQLYLVKLRKNMSKNEVAHLPLIILFLNFVFSILLSYPALCASFN